MARADDLPPRNPLARKCRRRMTAPVGLVVIGRNEGERLKMCLRSVMQAGPVVYVDSGSTDGSVAFARDVGATVVDLAVPPSFTAARARNSGVAALVEVAPETALVQTIDGDCELDPAWLATGVAALARDPGLGAVIGRLRERHPDRSLYNALCDHEWDGAAGEAPGFGGIALLRIQALHDAGGYRADMIAGEDTELAMRMRKAGWRIERVASDMARHDANILRFAQWWKRARRGGHAFAEMAYLHPDARWPDWPRTCRSIVAWGAVLPALALAGAVLALMTPWTLVVTAAISALYPLKAIRIAAAKRREGVAPRLARRIGALFMIGKFAEFLGLLEFHRNRRAGRASAIIEYKGAA